MTRLWTYRRAAALPNSASTPAWCKNILVYLYLPDPRHRLGSVKGVQVYLGIIGMYNSPRFRLGTVSPRSDDRSPLGCFPPRLLDSSNLSTGSRRLAYHHRTSLPSSNINHIPCHVVIVAKPTHSHLHDPHPHFHVLVHVLTPRSCHFRPTSPS